jgi:hypothetical protein
LFLKAWLTRALLADPAHFAAAHADADAFRPDAGPGDFALVAGDAAAARMLYARELAAGSDRPGAWSGLALARYAVTPDATAGVLLRRPEFVRGVHRRLGAQAPPVEALAAWLAGDR